MKETTANTSKSEDGPTSTSEKHFRNEKQDRAVIKHLILSKYLQAWFPIMSQGEFAQDKILFIDGFAGTGTFKGGKDGSPVIALKALLEHKSKHKFKSKIEFICIEKNKKHAEKLELAISESQILKDNPGLITVHVQNSDFQDAMQNILSNSKYKDLPMLLFADPFGYSEMPMELLNKVLSRPRTEVFVNVMDGFANRFFKLESHESNITGLVGSTDWIQAVSGVNDPYQKLVNFMKCYTDQLKATYTLKFSMKNNHNRHTYHLVFGTNHFKGLQVMKRAMASASQDMDCYFYSEFCTATIPRIDTTTQEYKLHCTEETFKMLLAKYRHHKSAVSGTDIDEFVWKDTPYISNFKIQLKKRLLAGEKTIKVRDSKKFASMEVIFCVHQEGLEPKGSAPAPSTSSFNNNHGLTLEPVSDNKLSSFHSTPNKLGKPLPKTSNKPPSKRPSDGFQPDSTSNAKKRLFEPETQERR